MKIEGSANLIAKALFPTDPKAPEHRKCADAIAYGIRIGLRAALKLVDSGDFQAETEIAENECVSVFSEDKFADALRAILAGDQDLPGPELPDWGAEGGLKAMVVRMSFESMKEPEGEG